MKRLLRWPVAGVLLLAAAAGIGCASSALKLAQRADDLRQYDVAVAQYMRALRENPTSREAQLGLDRARLRASDDHFARGRRLFAQGRYDDALIELQLASELNPTNADAERDLRAVRGALRAKLNAPESGQTALESLLARTRDAQPAGHDLPGMTLPEITTGQQTTSRALYQMIGKLAKVAVSFDPQFRDGPASVSLTSGMTIRQALDAVARSTGTFYQTTSPSTITVVTDSPAKRREYTEEVVRMFVIQNADLKETMDVLRVVADARSVSAVTGTNMIMVRDTPERVQVLGRVISAFDKARPEVVIDVEVLEIERNKLLDYGLQIATPGTTGIDGAADVANRDAGLTLSDLRNLSQADVLITNIPALFYRLIKTDSRTRTLANPHIRITDGVAAVANFGQDVPVPQTTITPITQTGVNIQPQTQFQYRTIGVNIGITPRTHPNDDITLMLNIELSSLGAPGFDGLPTFGKRNVATTIRLKDGETNILAGLIREDERVERQHVPGLGNIPVLGQLFGRTRREAQQTDVVVMMTPRIIRLLDLSEENLAPLRMPREGSGTALIDSAPIVPPPPPRGGGGGRR
jgi:general secretion pathway protein D